MASEMSGEQMQNRITAARRDAEGLKDKIRRKKDELADTTRKTSRASILGSRISRSSLETSLLRGSWLMISCCSPWSRTRQH